MIRKFREWFYKKRGALIVSVKIPRFSKKSDEYKVTLAALMATVNDAEEIMQSPKLLLTANDVIQEDLKKYGELDVTLDDCFAAGLCETGVKDWLARHLPSLLSVLHTGSIRGSVVIEKGIESGDRYPLVIRACRAAAQRILASSSQDQSINPQNSLSNFLQ